MMKIEQFAETCLNFKNSIALEVFQGYLIAGEVNKEPRCFWINKQNIEGLAEVAKILVIDSTFNGLLSLIPGGSFAYKLIKDQIGYPPRYNIVFEPSFYKITYSLITLDKNGEEKSIIDSLIQGIDNVTKFTLKTSSRIQNIIRNFVTSEKLKEKKSDINSISTKTEIIGFTYLRFEDKTSIVRNRIIKERIDTTRSKTTKLAKTAVTELIPSVVVSYKTIANEEAITFIKRLQKLGFNVSFSSQNPSIKNL